MSLPQLFCLGSICILIGVLAGLMIRHAKDQRNLDKADETCFPYKAYDFALVNEKLYAVCASNDLSPGLVPVKK